MNLNALQFSVFRMCLQSLLTSTLLTPITWLPTIGSSMMGLFSYIGVPETVQFYLFVIVMFGKLSKVLPIIRKYSVHSYYVVSSVTF